MDFPDTCTIQNLSAVDMYHNSTYAAAFTTVCRYREIADKPIRGENVVVTAWLALPPCTTVTTESIITLEDGSTPAILTKKVVRRLSDNGFDYIRIELGKTGVQ